MRKHENQSKQKFGKNACADLGNGGSIHLSYGSGTGIRKITAGTGRYKANGGHD